MFEVKKMLDADRSALGQGLLSDFSLKSKLSDSLPELHQGPKGLGIGSGLRPPRLLALLSDPGHILTSAANSD
jgi:hypothetical protein